MWLAIDPAVEENGCMQVIPGSHHDRNRMYQSVDDGTSVFDEALDPTEVDASRAVPITLAPNECSVHTASLVHGSHPNRSRMRRCGFTMRYISTAVRFNHEEVGDRHQIYLARGADRAGNVYADPAVPNHTLMDRRGRSQTYLGARRVGGAHPGSG